MSRFRALIAALAIAICAPLALAGPVAAAPPGGWTVKCGDHFINHSGWFNLKGSVVKCSVAKKVANTYVFKNGGESHGFEYNGWTCRNKQIADEVTRTRCKRDRGEQRQRIQFRFGA